MIELTDKQIDAITLAQWGQDTRPLSAHRTYARAVIAAHEAQRQAAKSLTDQIMDLAELMGNDPVSTREIDARAWQHLLVYAPQAAQPEKRPDNCGTGFCSCIECPCGVQS